MDRINCTVASPKANSFMDAYSINEFMSIHDPLWTNRTPSERYSIAMRGAADLRRLRYIGTQAYTAQNMPFPRVADVFVEQSTLTDATRENLSGDLPLIVRQPVITDTPWESVTVAVLTKIKVLAPVQQDDFSYIVKDTYIIPASVTVSFTINGADYSVTIPDTLADYVTTIENVVSFSYNADTTESRLTVFVDSASAENVTGTYTTPAPNELIFPDAIFDQASVLPDNLRGGSVHVSYMDGTRTYHTIFSNNIVTGRVTLIEPMDAKPVYAYILHQPVFREVIEAQKVQMLVKAGALDNYDPHVGMGIASIKIDTSSRSYMQTQYGGLNINELAARNKVAPQTMILIGRFTVYGKRGVTWEADMDALITSLQQ